jgi:hypothetical protein
MFELFWLNIPPVGDLVLLAILSECLFDLFLMFKKYLMLELKQIIYEQSLLNFVKAEMQK